MVSSQDVNDLARIDAVGLAVAMAAVFFVAVLAHFISS